MATVIHHARKDIVKLWVAFCLAVPLGEHRCGNFDVLPQFVRGMAAQEETVKKCRFPLRKVEIMHDFGGNELWHRDRKSTRLNSSHQIISYAVFCLKKKNTDKPLQ